jgi:hypothetical protein
MGRGSVAPSTEFSMRVVSNVDNRRREIGKTHVQLFTEAGLSKNYYWKRLNHELPFNTNDIDVLARVLGVEPEDLTSKRMVGNRLLRLSGTELARRLGELAEAPNAQGDVFRVSDLVDYLRAQEIDLTAERWSSLIEETAAVTSQSEQMLVEIATFFDVDRVYLTNFAQEDVTEHVEAQLVLRRTLKQIGGATVSARALGNVPTSALLQIAKDISATDQK